MLNMSKEKKVIPPVASSAGLTREDRCARFSNQRGISANALEIREHGFSFLEDADSSLSILENIEALVTSKPLEKKSAKLKSELTAIKGAGTKALQDDRLRAAVKIFSKDGVAKSLTDIRAAGDKFYTTTAAKPNWLFAISCLTLHESDIEAKGTKTINGVVSVSDVAHTISTYKTFTSLYKHGSTNALLGIDYPGNSEYSMILCQTADEIAKHKADCTEKCTCSHATIFSRANHDVIDRTDIHYTLDLELVDSTQCTADAAANFKGSDTYKNHVAITKSRGKTLGLKASLVEKGYIPATSKCREQGAIVIARDFLKSQTALDKTQEEVLNALDTACKSMQKQTYKLHYFFQVFSNSTINFSGLSTRKGSQTTCVSADELEHGTSIGLLSSDTVKTHLNPATEKIQHIVDYLSQYKSKYDAPTTKIQRWYKEQRILNKWKAVVDTATIQSKASRDCVLVR